MSIPYAGFFSSLLALERAGFQVVQEGTKYRIDDSSSMASALGIEAEEIIALFAARQLSVGLKGTGVARALDRLWGKLTVGRGKPGMLLPATPQWLSIRAPRALSPAASPRDLLALEQAARLHRLANCRYRARSTGQITSRAIEPGELHWDPGLETLYVIAYCRLREDVRIFAAHRFLKVVITDEEFVPRRGVTTRTALAHAFRLWRSKNVERVKIRFGARVGPELLERRWHASQRLEQAADGTVTLELEVAGLDEVERWVLGFGADATVLAPDELVDRIREHHARGVAAYGPAKTERIRVPI